MHNLKIWISHSHVSEHEHTQHQQCMPYAHYLWLFLFQLHAFVIFILYTYLDAVLLYTVSSGFLFHKIPVCVYATSVFCIVYTRHLVFRLLCIQLWTVQSFSYPRRQWDTYRHTPKHKKKQKNEATKSRTDSLQKRNAHMPISVCFDSIVQYTYINYRLTFSLAIQN